MLKIFASCNLSAGELLALSLKGLWGISPLPALARGARGKPYLPDHPHVHFSLSHSGRFALCAVGDVPVGADIERVRPRRAGLARYALDERAYSWFLARGARWDDFYVCWTRREAWCKWTGQGLAATWRSCLPEDAPVFDFEGPGWRAAICAEGAIPREISWISSAAEFITKA